MPKWSFHCEIDQHSVLLVALYRFDRVDQDRFFEMHIVLIYALSICIILAWYFGLKNTVLEVSWRRGSFSGLLMAREFFLFIVLGVLLFEALGVDSFHTFYMTPADVADTSITILATLLMLILWIAIFSKTIFKPYLGFVHTVDRATVDNVNEDVLAAAIAMVLVSLICVMHLAGMRHAFLQSVISGADLLSVRLANRYGSSLPTVVASFYQFLYTFLAVILGVRWSVSSTSRRVLYLVLLLYASSFAGGKAPVVFSIILLGAAMLSQKRPDNYLRMLSLAIGCVVAFYFAVFIITKIQFPELSLTDFNVFLLNRVGVGQIHGVYEQFVLRLSSDTYILHSVPFARMFADYQIFNKDLMTHTWGANVSLHDTGVMNSYFIGEALAIGGIMLVWMSPVIVAFNFCLTIVTVIVVMKKFFGINISRSSVSAPLLVVSLVPFTGDINGLLLFKLGIMIVLFMVPVLVVYRAMKNFRIGEG